VIFVNTSVEAIGPRFYEKSKTLYKLQSTQSLILLKTTLYDAVSVYGEVRNIPVTKIRLSIPQLSHHDVNIYT